MNKVLAFVCASIFGLASCSPDAKRQVISLNGEWEIAKTEGELPGAYHARIQVPGVVDLAEPAIDTAGALYESGWYWHKRSFELPDTNRAKIYLKIFKAKYFTKVYLNGQFVGQNPYCFTPSYFDLKPFLKPAGEPNELVIGVGCKNQLPDTIPHGHDYEKLRFFPGIYDNVELTLTDKPYINNIQCVPDIASSKLRVVAEIETDDPSPLELSYLISEMTGKRRVTHATIKPETTREGGIVKADFEIGIPDMKLWSPESPFLYELTLSTGADDKRVRFGMRTFRFDEKTGMPLLNEKPYFLRGTNTCFFRFLEDPDRGSLPWNSEWVEKLYGRFKDMHWTAIRNSIGFPPERWYEVCDSLGILLQDEYPIWTLTPQRAEDYAPEYLRWLRERWNHPSVVIWDANNETVSRETAKAMEPIRLLDLSDRPCENGWSDPMRPTDPCEAHPYIFQPPFMDPQHYVVPPEGYLKAYMGSVRSAKGFYDVNQYSQQVAETGVRFTNPTIINEYGWIWLNRDGSPTTLTDSVYDILWDGKNLTAEERFDIYARHIAMLTEYWRAHRQVVGIMQFCGLGYSRPTAPRGQTSDNWTDIRKLTFEPRFYQYVKPAFAPVGLMVDIWEKEYRAGTSFDVPVFLINDLTEPVEKKVTLTLLHNGEESAPIAEQTVTAGTNEVVRSVFPIAIPEKTGKYILKAAIEHEGETVFSLRDIPVIR